MCTKAKFLHVTLENISNWTYCTPFCTVKHLTDVKKAKKKQAKHDICVFVVRTKEVEGSGFPEDDLSLSLRETSHLSHSAPECTCSLLLSTMSQWVCLSPLRLRCFGKSEAQSLRGHIFIIHYVSFFPSLRWPCWWCDRNHRIKSHL